MSARLLNARDADVGRMLWASEPSPLIAAVAEAGGPDLETQLRQAYTAGVNEGENRARKLAEQHAREWAAQVASRLSEVAAAHARMREQAQADVVRLSLEIARRVLHREVSLSEQALSELIRAALEKLGAQDRYRARVHPGQATIVRQCVTE